MKGSRVLLALVLFAGVSGLVSAGAKAKTTAPTHSLPEIETRDLCRSNIAFDYTVWQFRKGYKALCCSYCKGSTEKVCLNAYDEDNNLYNACAKKTPESDAPCYNPDAEIPEHPSVVPGEPHQLPELETRNLCRSHIAFDYDTWSFRKGFRSLCCSYCAAGSMEHICLNVYDACGKRRNACVAQESTNICLRPYDDIPTTGPTCQDTKGRKLHSSLPSLEERDFCRSHVAFDYGLWQFRKGYKAECCLYCAEGSTEPICLNAYDSNNKLYNACAKKTPESSRPCLDANAPVPEHPRPQPPKPTKPTGKVPGVPEVVTRDTCRSNLAFDYTTWQFRAGYKALCCAYCRSGSMEHICLNVYDACGTRFNACATPETQAPCTNPNAPIPTHPPVCQPQEHHRMLLSKGRKPSTPAPTPKVPGVPETVTRDTCRSNLAFDYMTWQFRKGYKALCCAYCQSGSMEKICLNAYDSDNNLYNACKAPETDAPCKDVNAVIPDKPVTPEHRPTYNEHNSIPELMTRDICVSHLAFDYSTWQFRTGYKSLCCSYCRAGSMEKPCLNAYDACGNRYFACASPETPAPCKDPHAPIPFGYPYECRA